MLRKQDLKTGLATVRGWEPTYLTGQEIETDLTVSDSGLYYQSVHPLVTLQTVFAVAPRFDLQQFNAWATGESKKGSIYTHAGKNWVAESDTTQEPAEGASNWGEWTEIKARSKWLRDKTQAAAARVATDVYTEKVANQTAEEILGNYSLFTDPVSNSKLIENEDNTFVGLTLNPTRAKGLSLKINKIGLSFSGPTENITLYIFHTSKAEPVYEIPITRSVENGIEWHIPSADDEIILPFENNELGPGGSWKIGYNQTALSAQALNTIPEYAPNCFGQHLSVQPFKVSGYAGVLWDIDNTVFTPSENYGLNLQISVHCDPTDLIIEQKLLFENAVALQLGCDVLRELAYNPQARLTRETLNVDMKTILYELDGDSTSFKKSGLRHDLNVAKKAISLNLDALSPVCFKRKSKKIKIRTT